MTEVRSVSLPDKYTKWIDENVESLSEFIQKKIEEEMEG